MDLSSFTARATYAFAHAFEISISEGHAVGPRIAGSPKRTRFGIEDDHLDRTHDLSERGQNFDLAVEARQLVRRRAREVGISAIR